MAKAGTTSSNPTEKCIYTSRFACNLRTHDVIMYECMVVVMEVIVGCVIYVYVGSMYSKFI